MISHSHLNCCTGLGEAAHCLSSLRFLIKELDLKKLLTSLVWACLAALCVAKPVAFADQPPTIDFSKASDAQLTQMAANLQQLTAIDRRALLAELHGRMDRNKQQSGRVNITLSRRYGRVVRKPDGSVVVQTREVRVTPGRNPDRAGRQPGQGRPLRSPLSSPQQIVSDPQTASQPRQNARFGMGFEVRARVRKSTVIRALPRSQGGSTQKGTTATGVVQTPPDVIPTQPQNNPDS